MVDLRERLASEWRLADTRTEQSQFAVASVTADITLFEHREPAAAVDSETASSIPTRSLFAIALRFQPSLSTLGIAPQAGFSLAAPRAKRLVLEHVEADGICVDDQLSSERFERVDGTLGRTSVFSTAIEIGSGETDAPTREETATYGTIDTETHVAIWPTETSYGMAGGTVPTKVPESLSDRLAVCVDRDREMVHEFIQLVDTDD